MIENILKIKLDAWQDRVLRHKGNIALRCGRQTGKSTAVAIRGYKLSLEYPGTTTLIIAPAERQSKALYEKIRAMFEYDNAERCKKIKIEDFKNRVEYNRAVKKKSIYATEPTANKIILKNGSQILAFPCGETGAKIRFLTVDFLIVDEAQGIPEAVWIAVVPMLATSHKARGTGWIIMLGTPKGKRGKFFETFKDKDFLRIHVSAEKVKRYDKVFLKKQKRKLPKIEYTQEYLAEFIEKFDQYFATKLVEKCMNLVSPVMSGNLYLGVDFSRFGGDQNAFVIARLTEEIVEILKAETTEMKDTTATIGKIKNLNDRYDFKRIFVDCGGLGGPILDTLQKVIGKRKVIGLDNARKRIQVEGEEKKEGIFKQDLYANALVLMENNKLSIIKDTPLKISLTGMTFDYGTLNQRLRIFGKNSHLSQAFVNVCWCVKNRGSELRCY